MGSAASLKLLKYVFTSTHTFEKDVLQVILMELFITVSFLVISKGEMRQQLMAEDW